MRFNIGDSVTEKDGRHVGKVVARVNGIPKIEWPNGWFSYLFEDELELYERRKVAWKTS